MYGQFLRLATVADNPTSGKIGDFWFSLINLDGSFEKINSRTEEKIDERI